MINKLRTYLREGFTYSGLEVSEIEGKESYFLLKLKKSKNELVLTDKIVLDRLDGLPKLIKKNSSIFLCINTSSMLTKKVEGANIKNPEALVNQAFPNLDQSNFYYEVFSQDNESVITISKKENVDSLLSKLKDLKVQVSRFSLGVSALGNLLPYLDSPTIALSNRKLILENHRITELEPISPQEENAININGLELSNSHVLSFGQILGHLGGKEHSTNFEEVCAALKWGAKNQRIFGQVLKYALAFFLLLLLSNFFVYDFYHSKVSELNAAMASTSSQKEVLTLLGESVQKKQERVETLSNSSNSRATYYLDLFAQQIPNSILLTDIKYQPLAKPVRESKPIILEEQTLSVSGISRNVNDFSFWIEELERYNWVHTVETLEYDYVSKDTSSFLLEIGFYED